MKLVILDRDGVINFDSDDFIKHPDEWRPIPGSLEAIAQLTQAGWRVVVATNQSGIGRGLLDMSALNAINAKMHKAVNQAGGRIEAVFYCPDTAESQSPCRKPNPGMFHAIGERFNVALERVPAATCRKRRPSIQTSPRWRRLCLNDLPALARFRARPDPRHSALRDRRARHVSPAAARALPDHRRMVACDGVARQNRARHRLSCDR